MNLQYISDNLGNKTAVIIPINEWEKIIKKKKISPKEQEQEQEPFSKEMTQEEFVQWIEDAEKSASMTLEEFNKKWETKKQQIIKLIP